MVEKLIPLIIAVALSGSLSAAALAAAPVMKTQDGPRRPSKEEAEQREILDLMSRVLPRLRGGDVRKEELVVSEFRQGLMLAVNSAQKLPKRETSRVLAQKLV